MSVIIRLQNLPWSANALDIRQYFTGLSIPEGGVHIVGGELGDAFIAFSTDEDARQAFNRNNGKIKEVQISLMLSSRTEMQRVIEAARAQSYAAFMQPTPAAVPPIPAAVPSIVPAAVPEIKKEPKEAAKNDKRSDGRRRSRSKSRERKDRSRDRDRKDKRHRDRSRSRSRDRKDRRRRDRSRGRSRTRSRDRERRNSRDHRKRVSEEKMQPMFQKKPQVDVWANPAQIKNEIPAPPQAPILNFPINLEQAKRTLSSLSAGLQTNGFPGNNSLSGQGLFNNGPQSRGGGRDSWPPLNQSFQSRSELFLNKRVGDSSFQGRFQRNNFQGPRGNNLHYEEDLTECSVRLEPFYGSYSEVRRFFQGLFISNRGIKYINDASGRKTGVVYVQFANRASKEEALSLNGEVLNGIPVAVTHLDDNEFDDAIDKWLPNSGGGEESMHEGPPFRHRTKYFNNANNATPTAPEIKDFTCLIVEDLPTYCKEQDILHIFSQHPLVALILTTKPRGGNIAYVRFSSKEVAKTALEEKNHHIIGGKQVTVRPCKDDDFEEINKQHEVDLTGSKDEEDEDVGTDCLSGVIPTKIHLMSNSLGFTGQAYCEFLNVEEATRASKKDDTMLGNVHISVKPIKRTEMQSVLGLTLPTATSGEDEQSRQASVESPMDSPLQNEHLPANPRGYLGRSGFDSRAPRGPPRFGPSRGMPGPRHRFAPPQDLYDDMPPPGCTVFMKNVPYKAGTNEILDFFDGYNITNNVSRRYNPNNTPSDEAKVVFFDPDDAYRAVQELHQKKIWERQIFLRQE
ncbi:hypothetical protein NQ315_001341 [Exocentrus adspersus]|uniref:RRM domain-containing protein n=1 Tax=Exocentrus adspersus TaxID=1586481 RepID=A0AAV8WFC8_9CUCU|nr:hypothetical protein NQ315_001341 [Exocentrus adspersus]